MPRNRIACFVIVGIVATLTGCATPNLFKFSKNNFPTAGPKNPVIDIVGTWQPGTGVGLENKTCRGFSGQIFFFTKDSEIPAKVDGTVRFFVFDDQDPPEKQSTPVSENEFSPEVWNQFLGKGPMGASYQIFIPYVRKGYHSAKCVLRIRYTPRGGGATVYSDMVEIALDGKKKANGGDDQPIDDISDGGVAALETADAAAGLPMKPPYARGTSQSISLQDALPARRSRAPELTDEDRARMIREVRSRLNSPPGDEISLVSHEEPASPPPAVRRRPAKTKSRNPLLDDEQPQTSRNDVDDSLTEEASNRGAATAPAARPPYRKTRHPLEGDDDAALEPEADDPAPTRSWRKRTPGSAAQPSGHLLDDAARQSLPTSASGSAQTYTIQVPNSAFGGS